jgi:hypothetical protein
VGRAALAAGEDGARGRTLVNGEEQPAKVTAQLRAGDGVRTRRPNSVVVDL